LTSQPAYAVLFFTALCTVISELSYLHLTLAFQPHQPPFHKHGLTYNPINTITITAATQLSNNATIPLGVNPAGRGAIAPFFPSKSRKCLVLPAALHATRWPEGSEAVSWRERGASIMVATRPV